MKSDNRMCRAFRLQPQTDFPRCVSWIAVCGLLLLSGCEDGPAVAPVTGKVTRDGTPLAGIMIEFQPESGAPSYAFTNADGSYEMQYQVDRKGALIGNHSVRLTTPNEVTDPATGETVSVKESIPRAYNDESTLEFEVKQGKNEFNIEVEGERKRRR